MTGSQTTLRCPVQPGARVENYFGSWERRGGETLVEIPQPINGIPQAIEVHVPGFNLDKATFSLVIDSVDLTHAGDDYRCVLSVFNPESPEVPFLNLNTNRRSIYLMVNGKSELNLHCSAM